MRKIVALAALAACTSMPALADSHAMEPSAEPAELEAVLTLIEGAPDLAVAESIFGKKCRACHGNKAQGVASYPKLSDTEPEVLAEKLLIYRSGQKIGPNSVLMIQNAKDLSDEEIAALSIYVATAFD